ncbi:DUF3187 family protein [Azohydromonas aeria]|uniref:DUF3187 family protein n=1 Tax=Azohydromonas aeria TaxID=2590212 RepID=UPI001E47ADE9|nr:DUF3187 family protein [Azohydromonas aeria]
MCLLAGTAWAAEPTAESVEQAASRLESLQREITLQAQRLESLRQAMAQEQRRLDEVRQALGLEVLGAQRGGSGQGAGAQQPAQVAQSDAGAAPQPVGQAPSGEARPAAQVAQIFEQPGVLTPRGKFVLEPSLQYAYSSNNRVALVGYTIIPAITIGVIDVREVKRNTFTAALTGRYGLTNRLELEARIPYSYRSDDSINTDVSGGNPNEPPAFKGVSGRGIGDIELTARYQFNEGGLDKPYYIGSLRYKSRTGRDPFEVRSTLANARFGGFQDELPTGSGFQGLQPALTVLYPSDPAVFFGTISYLHNFGRSGLTYNAATSAPQEPFDVKPGGVFGFNFGMGLALNEKSSFSLGYDHSSVGRTKINGDGSQSVRVQLGTLVLGYSYRLSPERSLNVSLGVGATRDTPDITLTVRMPITF